MSPRSANHCAYCFAPIAPGQKACSEEHAAKLRKPVADPLLSRSEVAAILRRTRERRAAS